ncbi:hypothetical protein DSL64_10785 [Dyadobacter luteus]|uniref:Uncharacterized protein n=1 Tax=Dyadobacter luteus TaxID=2259619 RepID=A0A3D8YFT1_9BACT|nr:hypothetical protein DSL64_10785 [Dyadobacter luteus]
MHQSIVLKTVFPKKSDCKSIIFVLIYKRLSSFFTPATPFRYSAYILILKSSNPLYLSGCVIQIKYSASHFRRYHSNSSAERPKTDGKKCHY